MRYIILLFLCLLFSLMSNTAFSDTECPYVTSIYDRRTNKQKLRLMQYNVEWLFIDYYSAANCPGAGCSWYNGSEAETHMDYVAKVIKQFNPDIINLCEVEGCDELNILKDKVDKNYDFYLKKGTDTATGQNVGLLTKISPHKDLSRTETRYNYPIIGSNCGYTGSIGSTSVSKHYVTEFTINNINIAFISAHLIAIPNDPVKCAQREAQATILQNIIYSYIHNGYEVIMIGDFNDFDNEILDLNNNIPLSKTLDILKGVKGDYAGMYNLYSVAEMIPQQERYSDWWDSDNNCSTSSKKDLSMIDHILVTDFIRKKIVNAFIYHGYNEYCGKYNSDHYPLIVDIEL